jgi:hypothetical protein
MRVRLITPARTPVAFARREIASGQAAKAGLGEKLAAIPARLDLPLGVVTHFAPDDDRPRYVTLEEDSYSRGSSPVVSYHLPATLAAQCVPEPLIAAGWTVNAASLLFFSHHLCTCDIDLTVPDAALDGIDAGRLEAELGGIASALVERYWDRVSSLVASEVDPPAPPGREGFAALLHLFDRAPAASARRYDCLRPEAAQLQILWTNRTYLVEPGNALSPAALAALRYRTVTENGAKIGAVAYIFEGNNIVTDASVFDDFARGMHRVQYLYSTLDAIFEKYEDAFESARDDRSERNLKAVIASAESLEAMFSFYEIEVKRAPLTLQSGRRLAFVAALEFYGIGNIIDAIRIRANLLSRQIEREIQRRQFFYNRVVEAALVVISLFQVVSTFSDIYTLARSAGYRMAGDTPGILDISRVAGFNLLVNLAILVTVIIALIAARGRRNN